MTVSSALWLFWYHEKLKLNAIKVNAFDKEIITQFYEKNPDAQTDTYQKIKQEALDGTFLWYDVFPHGALRSRGDINSKLPNHHRSDKTECLFLYNLDTQTNKYYLERYDCTTRLRRGEIKKCLQESIKEGRVK